MPPSNEQLVRKIHDAGTRFVLALSGGGSRAITELLEVPGASRVVLEVAVPYCEAAMIEWLGARPDQFCSAATARAMAMVAFQRAFRYDPSGVPLAGFAATASLATDRPKRGPHRVHLAMQTVAVTASQSLELEKGRRTRAQEERLVTTLVLNLIAEACSLEERLPLDLLDKERVEQSRVVAPEPWRDLLLGRTNAIRHGGQSEERQQSSDRAVFPGAFNPLHVGHRRMAEFAQKLLGVPVELELSILNVDKPPLDYLEVQRRMGQFDAGQPVWLTRAPTFEEKSRRFPGATFLVGADTLRRIADPHYYRDDPAACRQAIEQIAARGCRFLVFGRVQEGRFTSLHDLDLPATLRSLCREVPAEQFREDVSSTEIRKLSEE
jgi:nicotinamide mononucleotide (NMN) deamidase PncC